MIKIYGLKNCDSCKKAMSALKAKAQAFEFIDIRACTNLSDLLPDWIAQIGLKKLVNTRSTTWRTLDEDTRDKALTGDIGTLNANPTLIKRPIIIEDAIVSVGLKMD